MNTKPPTLLLILTIYLLSGQLLAKHFWGGTTMTSSDVKKKWGSQDFDESGFKNGDMNQRSKMAYSILKNSKQYVGKSVGDIRKNLGPHDGFYYKDVFPSYLIQVGKSKTEETWQIVFELDGNRNVSDIFVHKNCCY